MTLPVEVCQKKAESGKRPGFRFPEKQNKTEGQCPVKLRGSVFRESPGNIFKFTNVLKSCTLLGKE